MRNYNYKKSIQMLKNKFSSAVRLLLFTVVVCTSTVSLGNHHIWVDGDGDGLRDDLKVSIKKMKLSNNELLAVQNYLQAMGNLFLNKDAEKAQITENMENVYRAEYCLGSIKIKPESLLILFEKTLDSDLRKRTYDELEEKGGPYKSQSEYKKCNLEFQI